jgi:DNA/RNA-binding domain of Phe-tRNA-synthetase-like protein
VRLAEEVKPLLRAGLVRAGPVAVGPAGPDLLGEMERTAAALAAEHSGQQPSEIPGLGPARDLYRAFRIDPTRTRPSSEALLRRVLQGKPLPRILNAVDLCNLLSLQFLLPLGLYDSGKIRGDVTLRRGAPGESYPGIRKDDVHIEGRPVLADSQGPFGNPTSDSFRTSVTPDTRSLWLVLFAPAAFPRPTLESYTLRAAEAIGRHLSPAGGTAATEIEVFP